ncbi:hypothetical protein C8F04DRAFT_1283552 [Mycena alexandri]|uniref:Glycan binding protein Y3-like domain-containing protein n=1 Tax=Mycena alexandri TaxID=1745969 RepID=A0AAD6WKW2_9AGAR|nr:hypothetical protein C8F04DRAFT_1283552 [Mycena alexandri]
MLFTSRTLLSLVSLAVFATPGLGQQLQLNCTAGAAAFNCASFVPSFCSSMGNITTINGNSTYSGCFAGPGPNQSCVLTALSTISSPFAVNVTNCASALNAVSAVCPMGGVGMFTAAIFKFAIDPNNGACAIPIGN